MKKIITIISISIIILIVLLVALNKITTPNPKEKTSMKKMTPIEIKLENMEDINYKLYNIPDSTVKLLKEKTKFKEAYKGNKNFVIYIDGEGCPYSKEYQTTLKNILGNKKYTKKYKFIPRDAQYTIVTMKSRDINIQKRKDKTKLKNVRTINEGRIETDFIKNCSTLCIVNIKKNEMFSLIGATDKEAKKLEFIIENFNNW